MRHLLNFFHNTYLSIWGTGCLIMVAGGLVIPGGRLGYAEELTRSNDRSFSYPQIGSPASLESSLRMTLNEQQEELDQSIARVEALMGEIRYRHHAVNESLSSPQPTVVSDLGSDEEISNIQSLTPASEVGGRISEDEVHVLEETLVEDTFLDPFDEGQEEKLEDPWESVNSRIFAFNIQVDRYVLKPLAYGYERVVPDPVEDAIGRAIRNVRFVPRMMNNLFQGEMKGMGLEFSRFLLNSTMGVAGFFDVAQEGFGLMAPTPKDTGQTMAVHGVGPGPYLVLPLLPPTTVRDGVGLIADTLLDPVSWVLPFVPQASLRGMEIGHGRAQNLELFEGVEHSTVDLYGAVRGAYSQRRHQAIQQ